MSGEEDDYMSDDFLAKCVQQDVCPGLKKTHTTKRDHALEKKRIQKMEMEAQVKRNKLSKQFVEAEKRKEGLETRLNESNKGFAMLQRMGFKSGDGLGKEGNKGRTEPIHIEVKTDRFGLGRELAMKKIAETKNQFRKKHQDQLRLASQQKETSAEDFRKELSRRNKVKQVEHDLYKSQKTCHQLDVKSGFKVPAEVWFWPDLGNVTEDLGDIDENVQSVEDVAKEASDSSEGENEQRLVEVNPRSGKEEKPPCSEFSSMEKLEILSEYLRTQYFYCLWCGIPYQNEVDLFDTCPGPTKEDHDK